MPRGYSSGWVRCAVRRLAGLGCAAALVAAGSSPARLASAALGDAPAAFNPAELQAGIFTAVEKASPAVVGIVEIPAEGKLKARFSGVIVSRDGYVLTTAHTVTADGRYHVYLADGKRFEARTTGFSKALDCAAIKIDGEQDLPFAELGDLHLLRPNQPCVAIGHPQGRTPGRGAVVRFGHIVKPTTFNGGLIHSTAMMEPGDSGGGLFDIRGRLIGIRSRILKPTDSNFDVPVNTFVEYWDQVAVVNDFEPERPQGVPELGLVFDSTKTLEVQSVTAGGRAEKAGLLAGDVITKVGGKRVRSIKHFHYRVWASRVRTDPEASLQVLRDGEPVSLVLTYLNPQADASSFPGVRSPQPSPLRAFKELPTLAEVFAEQESRLDDACVTVRSELRGETTEVTGARILGADLVVSKSSRVGAEPMILGAHGEYAAQVVRRDRTNDLVLLRVPGQNTVGIDLASPPRHQPQVGQLLITPDSDGQGLISVCSTGEHRSKRRMSVGYFGVRFATERQQGRSRVVLERLVEDGAASGAGLRQGDVITRINGHKVANAGEASSRIRATYPNDPIDVEVLREDETFKATIVLPPRPPKSKHAAEAVSKSVRRDGFPRVIAHDADLTPEDCGGPLFDTAGNLVGINIARSSRVQSLVVPVDVVREFVERERTAAQRKGGKRERST